MNLNLFSYGTSADHLEPVRAQMHRVAECARSIPAALRAYARGETQRVAHIHKSVQDLEQDAGRLTLDVLRDSSGTVYAGVSRLSLLVPGRNRTE